MTNCWPTRSRWPWCAGANAPAPAARWLGDGSLRARALARFGHELTEPQREVLAEIDADLAAPHRMLRLLQGDVGAGKTLVAVLAMLRAVESGAQAALMAPTEILARQHLRTLERLCPVPVALLTGSVTGKPRARLLEALADGSLPIVIGTHALVQEAVAFHDLGLAVIDEQHRFGVDQRLLLGKKGQTTDVLVMTATPDPAHHPADAMGRDADQPPDRQARRPQAGADHAAFAWPRLAMWWRPWCARWMAARASIGCARWSPRTRMWTSPPPRPDSRHFRHDSATLSGSPMASRTVPCANAALADFAAGRTRILVATTVIEVGVDVPEASVMVVEHAERFGLAQLHQLRGRVGRGAAASYCLLLHEERLNETARRRLTAAARHR